MADGLDLRERQAPAPEGAPRRSRKPTRRWCRGKVGREHVTEVRLDSTAHLKIAYCGWDSTCRWWQTYRWQGLGADRHSVPRGDWRWSCSHVHACVNCGKVLSRVVGRECPGYRPREQT